jgi:hypothetical protein
MLSMLTNAYPELDPTERLLAAKTFDEALVGIGVPHRAPTHAPEAVHLAACDS